MNILYQYYEWFKVFHIISVISWIAGLLYLPRLYVYHTRVEYGSEADKIFQDMEKRLLRIIMNPAMISTIFFGLLVAYIHGFEYFGGWFHIKMFIVIILCCYHAFLSICRKNFATNVNLYSGNFYRIVNEVPTLCMILIVIMVVIKPF